MMTKTNADEIDSIVVALDQLITTVIQAEKAKYQSSKAKPIFEILTIADIRAEEMPTRAHGEARRLIKDPIGTACRMGIRRLGEHLYSLGQTDLMGQVCERVADLDKSQWGSRVDILDKNWNAIGSGADLWLA